jgi:hypothetical protein
MFASRSDAVPSPLRMSRCCLQVPSDDYVCAARDFDVVQVDFAAAGRGRHPGGMYFDGSSRQVTRTGSTDTAVGALPVYGFEAAAQHRALPPGNSSR